MVRSIRVKIAALLLVPLICLAAIWGFAATLTLGAAQELLSIRTVFDNVIVPTRAVGNALQAERLGSLGFLGSGRRADLSDRRLETDRARESLERLSQEAADETPAPMRERVQALIEQMDRLAEIRSRVDTGNYTRLQTLEHYCEMVDAAFRVFDKMRITPDLELIDQTRAVIIMGKSREHLSEESALIAGFVGAKEVTGEELEEFRENMTERKVLYELAIGQLDDELRAPYLKLDGDRFEAIEERIAASIKPSQKLPDDAGTWLPAATAMTDAMTALGGRSSTIIASRARPMGVGVLVRLGVAGGLGLVAVVMSVFVSVRFGRRMGAELGALQTAALDLADQRLPEVVAKLSRGEDVCSEPPSLPGGTTAEIVRVAEAFGSVQRTAVQAAVGQAELRKGVAKVFLNLARRSQSLLHRQLATLETMENRTTDEVMLHDLYALDHLTTRMRRHAEGLIILSGSAPGRGWRLPVSIFDVVRAAVEEVEDYLRVTVAVQPGPCVAGGVVADVAHLVAELVENATIYSPPHTQVFVRGESVARGYAIEVEDRGLGMTADELSAANERLAAPPEFDLADSDRLGLFVVGRLAVRHGIKVSLRVSPYGGTTAIVLIPAAIVVEPTLVGVST
ncbi:nitrate- and nitrite sensing domain-containing protein [Nonomuraea sp. NPDC050556]|uniref:sensor histidine kinase n=1 Tax=Nonomuraea sp. NPDC050556 TaxID=3364369 RepID=UPI0037B630D3